MRLETKMKIKRVAPPESITIHNNKKYPVIITTPIFPVLMLKETRKTEAQAD